MLEETLRRVATTSEDGLTFLDPAVIAGVHHAEGVAEQARLAGMTLSSMVLEPFGRNTAAVAAVAACMGAEIDDEVLVLLLPADHHIADVHEFHASISRGVLSAQAGSLITFGIAPTAPETGYGYIKTGIREADGVFKIDLFREKPDLETAQGYLDDGDAFWNSGMFLFHPGAMLKELEEHAPAILQHARRALETAVEHPIADSAPARLLGADAFAECPSDSIDCAVMEKSSRASIVAPVEIGWNDIGAWAAVADLIDPSEDTPNVITIDTKNTLIRTDGPLVAAIGVEDLVIVVHEGAVLISRLEQTQDVKQVVETLKEVGRHDLL